MFNSRMSKLFIIVVVALILATSAYTFAASNTVPGTVAGEGAGAVSGYTVSAIAYTLGATPSNIASVAFTLSGPATSGTSQPHRLGRTFLHLHRRAY